MSRSRFLKLGAVVAALVILAPTLALSQRIHTGQTGVLVPEMTTEGNWDGTWFYASAEAKIVLWMRTRWGKPEIKLKYESGLYPLSFETDWSGVASYYAGEQPATFEIRMNRRDAARIEGTWTWETQFGPGGRNEKGTFSLYRTLDGRTLALKFETLEVTLTRGGISRRITQPPVWTFVKASKRHVLWDEIPF